MGDAHHRDGVCLHCGGEVDEKGYSSGGLVENGGELGPEVDQTGMKLARPKAVSSNSPQRTDAARMRELALSLGGRR